METPTSELMRLQLPTDQMILRELQNGRNLGANVAEDIDRHKKTVTTRLRQMQDYGLVDNIGRGVYELTEKGQVALELIGEYDDPDEFEKLVEQELERRA